MDWYSTVFEIIDMRSFSNLWYWIALAVAWSSVSHWVMGVPFDMIQRASRQGGDAQIDLEDLVRINSNRLLYIAGMSGLWLLGISAAIFTSLAFFWAFGTKLSLHKPYSCFCFRSRWRGSCRLTRQPSFASVL